jgi:hypothetical protein
MVAPDYWKGLMEDEKVWLLAHEVAHVMARHHVRMAALSPLDHRLANVAADAVIRRWLDEAGYVAPYGAIEAAPPGESMETVYWRLLPQQPPPVPVPRDRRKGGAGSTAGSGSAGQDQDQQEQDQQEAPGSGSQGQQEEQKPEGAGAGQSRRPVPDGAVLPIPREEAGEEKKFLDSASQAAGYLNRVAPPGRGSVMVERLLAAGERRESGAVPDILAAIRHWVGQTLSDAHMDYSLRRPNLPLSSAGVLMRGLAPAERTPRVLVLLDTSGSVLDPLARRMAVDAASVITEAGAEAVIYCADDCLQVRSRLEVAPGQSLAPEDVHIMGRGGTSLAGPLAKALELEGPDFEGVIYFTDGCVAPSDREHFSPGWPPILAVCYEWERGCHDWVPEAGVELLDASAYYVRG